MADATREDVVRVLAEHLSPGGRDALGRVAARLGNDYLDAVDASLRLYRELGEVSDGQGVTFTGQGGSQRTAVVMDATPPDRWRMFTYWPQVCVAFAAGLVLASLLWWLT